MSEETTELKAILNRAASKLENSNVSGAGGIVSSIRKVTYDIHDEEYLRNSAVFFAGAIVALGSSLPQDTKDSFYSIARSILNKVGSESLASALTR